MLALRVINWSLSNIWMCSMEVFDEHQIAADVVGLAIQNQPLIR